MPCNPAMKAPLYGPAVPSWAEDDSHMTEPNKLPHHAVPDHQPAAGGIAARARAAATPQYLAGLNPEQREAVETLDLSLIHISEPTRLGMISYAVFCLKKKKK